ncbi:MAG TPA: zf-TFIIB domain-containing protein [Phycisphaerales bacterium]|nr:zf-TFIIB domain-containing protein [Phycisphaerales bacterium]
MSDRTAPVYCPSDGVLMERIPAAGIEADRCPVCGGVWLDGRELERVLGVPGAAARLDRGPSDPEGPRGHLIGRKVCPRDRRPLVSIPDPEQPHITTELCMTCGGVHLDAGELRDLSELSLRERLRGLVRRIKA